jgi:Rieske Fe-S protein
MALNSEQESTKVGNSRRQWLTAIASILGVGVGMSALARYMRTNAPSYTRTVNLGRIDDVVPLGAQRTLNADGVPIIVVRPADAQPYAMIMECTHAGCPLALQGRDIVCGCHGGVFDLKGLPQSGPPKKPLTRIPYWVTDAVAFVRLDRKRKA